jgi:hypothetical protein
MLASLAEGAQRLLVLDTSPVFKVGLAYRGHPAIIIQRGRCLRVSHACGFSGKRWRHINLLLLLLFKELAIVLRRLVLGTLASPGWLRELFVSPLVLARAILGRAILTGASALLPGASVRALLDLEISGDLGLDVLVPLGRLPHVPLVVSVLLDLVDRFLEYDCPCELSDLPLIVAVVPELVNLLVVDLLRLGLQLSSLVGVYRFELFTRNETYQE